MDDFLRRTWVQVDLDAIRHNYQEIRRAVNPQAGMMAVVKADGYGHGAVYVARELAACGAEWFAVSNIEEAVELRLAGLTQPILILGYTPPQMAGELARHRISQTVFSASYGEALSKGAAEAGVAVNVHVKIDTGMSRLGFFCQQEDCAASIGEAAQVCALPGLVPEGIFTHFAVSDEGEEGEAFTRRQFEQFCRAVDGLREKGVRFRYRHCCNSAGVLCYPDMNLDLVRPGIILYGLAPSGKCKDVLSLRPAMELKSVISMVKEIGPAATVSYGRTFTAERAMRVATVPVGYADGYPRLASSKTKALVAGKPADVVGRVCMDQLMLDVTGIPEAKEGMTVTMFGRDGEAFLPIEALSDAVGTIPYETVCLIGKRVPRVYVKDGRVIGVADYLKAGE